jgi:hypothetical protein
MIGEFRINNSQNCIKNLNQNQQQNFENFNQRINKKTEGEGERE